MQAHQVFDHVPDVLVGDELAVQLLKTVLCCQDGLLLAEMRQGISLQGHLVLTFDEELQQDGRHFGYLHGLNRQAFNKVHTLLALFWAW